MWHGASSGAPHVSNRCEAQARDAGMRAAIDAPPGSPSMAPKGWRRLSAISRASCSGKEAILCFCVSCFHVSVHTTRLMYKKDTLLAALGQRSGLLARLACFALGGERFVASRASRRCRRRFRSCELYSLRLCPGLVVVGLVWINRQAPTCLL